MHKIRFTVGVFSSVIIGGSMACMGTAIAGGHSSEGHTVEGHAGDAHSSEAHSTEGHSVTLNFTSDSGLGEAVGTVMLKNTEYGLLIVPELSGLMPGLHGFHIHENPDCGPAEKEGRMVPGLAAGGHFDPEATGFHDGPYGAGHLGDLPPLYVSPEGTAETPILAPRLTVEAISQRAIMVHMGGDNFSDDPAPLGGGGARLACGVIQ